MIARLRDFIHCTLNVIGACLLMVGILVTWSANYFYDEGSYPR